MSYVPRLLPDKYRSAFEKTHSLPSIHPTHPASFSQTPHPPRPPVSSSSSASSLRSACPETDQLGQESVEEEEGYLRLGWMLVVFTLGTFAYVALAMMDFYWFAGSVLIVCLTEGTGLVVYSTLVGRWACWYCRSRAGKIAAQSTRHLPGVAARRTGSTHQFELLRTDTTSCLHAIRLRRE